MRYLIAGGALLLAGVVAAVILIPRLVDEARIERHLALAVLSMTGQEFEVDGTIDVKLLPQPLLTVNRPALGTDADDLTLKADRLDLEVALLPLLLGRLEVMDARLVRPDLRLAGEPRAAILAIRERLAAHGGSWPWQRLGIVGGRIGSVDQPPLLQAIDGSIEREGEAGGIRIGFRGQLAAAARAGTLQLDGHVGRVPEGRPIPIQAQLTLTRDGVLSQVDFRGLARLADGARELDGRLSVDIPSPASLAMLLPDGDAAAAYPLLPEAPLSLEAALSLDLAATAPAIRLDEATLLVGGQPLTGRLALDLGPAPEIALELLTERLDLPDGAPATAHLPFALAQALPAGLGGNIELRAGEVGWRGLALRQVAIELVLDGAGAAEIARASAVLPGPGDLAFSGRLAPLGREAAPRLTGQLAMAIQEPAVLARSFMTPLEAVRRSTTLSLETDLAWERSGVTLRGADLRLDALRAEGGMAWRAGADGRPPQLAVQARIDRLALDDMLDREAPQASVASLLDQLAATDLALDLRVERASFDEARLGSLVLDLDANDGQVAINRLSLTDLAGSAATLDGGIAVAAGTFDLDLALDVASLPRLLRLLGREPPPALILLGPLNLRARLTGDDAVAAIEATVDADQFAASGSGRIDAWQAVPSGELRLAIEAPEAAALIRQLGGVPVTDPLLQGTLGADLVLELHQGAVAAASLEATLGSLTLALDGARGAADTGPLDRFGLRLGPLGIDTAELLYRLATPPLGLVPSPPIAWPGYWPAQELNWRWLRAQDGELAVTLELADPTISPLEINLQLRDGLLTAPAMRFESEQGLIEASLALAGRPDGQTVEVAMDVAAQDLALASLLKGLGLGQGASTGELDLEARLRSHGGSLRALVANLQGDLDLVVTAGTLGAATAETGGIPVERLDAPLAIERGVLLPRDEGVSFVGADGTGRIAGSIDLLAWMLELELALDGHGGEPLVRQRFFGPLGEPLAVSSSLPQQLRALPLEPSGPAPSSLDLPAD